MSITGAIRASGANCNKSLIVLESNEKLLRITRAKYALTLQYRQNNCHLLESWSKCKITNTGGVEPVESY